MGAERRGRGGAAGAPLIDDAGAGDAGSLRELFREYAAWLGPEGWFGDPEAELAALPRGYVRPAGRGSGVGRALVVAIVDKARELGHRTLRLDTLPTMDAARELYLSLGFRPIERYDDNPVAGVLFFELRL